MALNAWQKKSRGMKGRRAKGRADMCVELGCYTCRVMKKDLTWNLSINLEEERVMFQL